MTGATRSTQSVELPENPDAAETVGATRNAVHMRPAFVWLVFAGGTLGTAARAALVTTFPSVNGVPYTVLAINLCGAFLLGTLIEQLARRGPDVGRRRALRLLLGTGFMGGFTTYSSLAADTAVLLRSGMTVSGIGYALATVVVGAMATATGIVIAGRAGRPRPRGKA